MDAEAEEGRLRPVEIVELELEPDCVEREEEELADGFKVDLVLNVTSADDGRLRPGPPPHTGAIDDESDEDAGLILRVDALFDPVLVERDPLESTERNELRVPPPPPLLDMMAGARMM